MKTICKFLMLFIKYLILFLIGGSIYYLIEFVYKSIIPGGVTHWSMGVLGGVMFLLLGSINEVLTWEMPLLLQGIVGSLCITAAELASGVILNIYLGLGIWDYSNLPFNLYGQICLQFSLIWIALSIVGIVLDDYLRYWLFSEEEPHYSNILVFC